MDGKIPLKDASLTDYVDAQARLSLKSHSVHVTKRAANSHMDHTYHDYSQVPESLAARKLSPNFPSKLYLILSDPKCSHIISWMPHGRAWKIHNKELLIGEVVPNYFSHKKYESFTRQLSGWGFKLLHQSGNDFNAYYHEFFLRGRPHLIGIMKRVLPNQGKLLPHAKVEPNFYEIDKQFPLSTSMMPYQGQCQYPPSYMEVVAGYGARQEYQAAYHTSHNQFTSAPGTLGLPPPVHGHCGDPYAVAAYNPLMGGYSSYPPQYPMQHGHQPYRQYPCYSYPPGPPRFISSNSDNAPPSDADTVKSEEVPFAEAVMEEVAITLQKDEPASDSLWRSDIMAESENK